MLLGHDLLEPTVDTRVWREALSLIGAGYEVTVFCWARRDDSLPAEEIRDGVRVRRIFASLDSWLPGRMLAFRSAMRQLAEAAADELPAVVHAHDLETLPAACRAADACDARVVFDAHEDWPLLERVQGAALGAWFGWQQRRWLPRADTVVTVSPELAKRLGGAEVLYNSEPLAVVEASAREDLRAKLRLDGVVAGYIGALRRRIIEQLLDDAAQVPEVTLLVVGGPPKGRAGYAGLQEQLETYATKVGARAVFTGPLAYDRMGDCYRACDLLLVGHYVAEPLRHAAVPKKLLDAMAYSIPAVVGPYEARRSIVERHHCGLVTDDWLAPLRKLAGDGEQRREMGLRGAAAWREKYCWDRMEERLLALYAGLLATAEVP